MIFSQYNEFIVNSKSENAIYLFNCMSRRWLELDVRLADIIKMNLDSIDNLKEIHPELFDAMISGKFVNIDRRTEIGECMSEINKHFNSKQHLNITINPTLDCNLRCWYCYEKHLDGSCMDDDTLKKTIAYFDKTLTQEVNSLELSFFGGEPLLGYKRVIKPIVAHIEEICKERNIELQLHFTTNATLLTKEILDDLKPFRNRTHFQIAFDGNRENHDKIKFFAGGKGSYDNVLSNTRSAIKKGYSVSLRCNYSKKSLPSFLRVIEDFKDLLDDTNLRFSFNRIWQEKEDAELVEIRTKFISQIEPYNIKSNINTYLGNSLRPCYGDYRHNIVINYNGDVFKCTARDFKRENRIGYINPSGELLYTENAISRMQRLYTPYCYGCRILPICPICSQSRAEADLGVCPIKIDNHGMTRNIRAAFHDISGVKV